MATCLSTHRLNKFILLGPLCVGGGSTGGVKGIEKSTIFVDKSGDVLSGVEDQPSGL